MGAVDKSLLLCKKLKKPSEANKRHLAKLFPSSSGTLPRPKPLSTAFDPIAECVASSQQQKKKAAITRERPRKLTCVLLPEMPAIVPKSSCRKRLNKVGRIQKLEFRRSMSSLQTRNTIIKGFAALKPYGLKFLQCTSSNEMCLADDQNVDGEGVITLAGQGSLYMCEDVKVLINVHCTCIHV